MARMPAFVVGGTDLDQANTESEQVYVCVAILNLCQQIDVFGQLRGTCNREDCVKNIAFKQYVMTL